MIDTIKFRPRSLYFRSDVSNSTEWEVERRSRSGFKSPKGKVYCESQTLICIHRQTKLRVYGDALGVRNVEGSLARILHGDNSCLIKSQYELDASWLKLESLVAQVADGNNFDGAFCQVHLWQHFDCNPADIVRAYKVFHYPNIDSVPTPVGNETLLWTGSKLRCRMYDKGKEQTDKRSNILRVEFALFGEKLNKLFNGNLSPVTELNFSRCTEVYLDLLSNFSPHRLPKPGRIAEFLAIALAEGWQSNGVSALDLYLRGKSPQHERRLRKQITGAAVQYQEIDLRKLLSCQISA